MITDRPLQLTKWLSSKNEIILQSPLEPRSTRVAFQKSGTAWNELVDPKDEKGDAPVRVSLDEDLKHPARHLCQRLWEPPRTASRD